MVLKSTILWYFVLSTLVVATTVFSKHIYGLEESHTEWKRSRLSSPWKRALPPSFFAGNRRPEGLPDISRGKDTPQTLPNDPPGTTPYFFSLFDPSTNTPFYSAYKVTPDQAGKLGMYSRPNANWRNPIGIPGVDKAYKEAITTDGEPLSRGHMNPSVINSFDLNFMKATFTLTNAVPQFEASNSGPWQEFETKIRDYAKNICGPRGGTLYLLTGRSENGIIPDAQNPNKAVKDTSNTVPKPYLRKKFINQKVNLETPRSVWTAGCCVWTEPGKVTGNLPARKAESFAVMSNNQKDKSKLYQTQMSVLELEELLKASSPVNLFPGDDNCRNPSANNII